jgi:hypothetical protein
MLLGPHFWTGGHVVGVVESGHVPDASDLRLVKPSLKQEKPRPKPGCGSFGRIRVVTIRLALTLPVPHHASGMHGRGVE